MTDDIQAIIDEDRRTMVAHVEGKLRGSVTVGDTTDKPFDTDGEQQ